MIYAEVNGLSQRPNFQIGCALNVRVGSTPEVRGVARNVCCWGTSGSRFRATGCLLVAKSRSQAELLRAWIHPRPFANLGDWGRTVDGASPRRHPRRQRGRLPPRHRTDRGARAATPRRGGRVRDSRRSAFAETIPPVIEEMRLQGITAASGRSRRRCTIRAPRRRRQNLETAYCEEVAGPHAEGVTKDAKLVGCADGVVD